MRVVMYIAVVLFVIGQLLATQELIATKLGTKAVEMIGSTSATLTRASNIIFLTALHDNFQGLVLAKHAHPAETAKTATVFLDKDRYSQELRKAFRDAAEQD